MTISVVIPTLNEAAYIERTLDSVIGQPESAEIIVVDGGSLDETVAIASVRVRVLHAPKGRASQMNAGAQAAEGDVLLFLHADTNLPRNALAGIRKSLSKPAVIGGCFRLKFDSDRFWFRVWTSRIWMRHHALAFGDRALFVRRSAFEAVGGFSDQPMFEDLELVRRLRREGRFDFLEEFVETSARRFHRIGPFRQQMRNLWLWLGWLLGLSAHILKRFYPDEPGEREALPPVPDDRKSWSVSPRSRVGTVSE